MTCAADITIAQRWAEFYRSRGLNPLPSRVDAKRPMVRFAPWWDEPAPADLFDRHRTANVQVMTGRRWRLLVIDLDGPEAIAHWPRFAPCCPTTWVTHSGGGGEHWWFTIPRDLPPMPKARLWGEWESSANDGKGDWARRKAIERLCDRSLIMAPPSIHPTTGRRYRFRSAAESPARLPFPAPCPGWILGLPPLATPRPVVRAVARPVPASPVSPGRFRAADVLDAIGDNKVALAESWGLRVASRRENHAGWCPCHAIGREDRTPSASISARTGRYWEPGDRSIGLFDLAVRLGAYFDWRDAAADLGRRFGVREVA